MSKEILKELRKYSYRECGQEIIDFDDVERVLNKMLKSQYINMDADGSWSTSDEENATHRHYEIIEPLEPEKVECEHDRGIGSYDAEGNCVGYMYKFQHCPKCGERLKDE